jgi:hypothetical protein
VSDLPSEEEQANLDAHVAQIFEGVVADDPASLEADRERVRRVHALACLIERYYDETGTYPLVDPVEGTMCNVLVGNPHTRVPRDSDYYAREDSLLVLLQDVLGWDVALPVDPDPDLAGVRCFAYGAYGSGYTVATMLANPVGWSEGILPGQFQYRLGSYESLQLPVLETRKLLAGEYPNNRTARWRDPSMANQGN